MLRGLIGALCLVLIRTAVEAQSYTITTLAGLSANPGNADGTGSTARFGVALSGMVTDSSGNIFIVDRNNATIRKMTPAGVVSTFAGAARVSSYVDANGTAARFVDPTAITCDSSGNLYVGDRTRVRKISPSGDVTTLVAEPGLLGSATPGNDVWGFNGVTALAVDASNNLYVAESTRIRKILFANGTDMVWAGGTDSGWTDGLGSAARFGMIGGMVCDPAGNLFLVDSTNHTIRQVTPAGMVNTLAGAAGVPGYANGGRSTARFNVPDGIAIDAAGNLYIVDANNYALRRLTPGGIVTTLAGGRDVPRLVGPDGRAIFPDGVGALAHLALPTAVIADASGMVYLADSVTIRAGTSVPVAPKIIVSPQSQTAPAGGSVTYAAVANGNPTVAYRWQRQISGAGAWLDLSDGSPFAGTTTSLLTVNPVSATMNGDQFRCIASNSLGNDASAAASLAVDPPVVVVPLRVTTLAGNPSAAGGSTDGTGSAATFAFPAGIAVDAIGNAYVADMGQNVVRKITPTGVVTRLAGSGTPGSADGVGKAAQFNWPVSVAVDPAGNVYVADALNYTVRKITPGGTVMTFAGVAGQRGTTDGTGANARFAVPNALQFDARGNLIVLDRGYPAALRQITPAGVVTTLPIIPSSDDEAGNGSQWSAFVINAAGDVYFANSSRHTIEKRSAAGNLTTIAGKAGFSGSTDGRATNARFNGPSGLAIDRAGKIYVADQANSTIRRLTPGGMVSTVAGLAPTVSQANPGSADGIGTAARFNFPSALAFDGAGNLYIGDILNRTIRRASSVDSVAEQESVEFYADVPTTTASSQAAEAVSGATPYVTLTTGKSYQWFKDGGAVATATNAQFKIAAATRSDAGDYSVQVATADATVTSDPVHLSVNGSRLANLSIRCPTGTGSQTLIVGFSVQGAGLPVLIRGVGPALTQFGVSSPVSHPALSVYAGGHAIAHNETWGDSPDIAAADVQVGTFVLDPGSFDAALVTRFDEGTYGVHCTAADGGTGVALIELYDTSITAGASARMINLSARGQVGSGQDVMMAGFAVIGRSEKRLLIRGIGPSLTQFSVSGVIADPQLQVFRADKTLLAQNDDWATNTNAAEVAAVTLATGAFPLAADSKDAALLVTLSPGVYTVHLSDTGNRSGVGLIEVYEAP